MTITTDRDWGREGIGTSSSILNQYDTMGIRLEGIESGPSRSSSSSLSSASSMGTCGCETCLDHSQNQLQPRSSKRQRKSHRSSTSTAPLPLISLFLLPFLPLTSAIPAPAPPPTRIRRLAPRSPTPSPDITSTAISSSPSSASSSFNEHRNIQYLTSVSTPSILPTDSVYVDETVLPYLLTKNDQGYWRRAEGGWSLYGRQIATPTMGPIFADDGTGSTDTAEPTVTVPSYAVESVLPNGWGVSSNRTSIYKVPLISIASVIMATGIVALIIFIVISRRKRHRKRKRAKERLRRKALAAAGIKEEDLNSGATEAKFRDKLQELENQHASRKKKNGQIGFAKNKVRVWNQRLGMRRRKVRSGQKDSNEDEDGARLSGDQDRRDNGGAKGPTVENEEEEEEEDKPVDGVDQVHSASPTSVLGGNGDEGQEGVSRRSSSDSTRRPDEGGISIQAQSTSQTVGPNGEGVIPYFPPAYRPASVRSLPRHNATSSTSAGPSSSHPSTHTHIDRPTIVSGTEKTQAPGYYPAPATEDGEIALAVVSRSEGKSRMVEPPLTLTEEEEEREERIRHIATDDKRVLERLRLGASAPPIDHRSEPTEEGEGENQDRDIGEGPSAPTVQIDDQGFEQLDESHLHVPPGDSSEFEPIPIERDHLPAPPRLNARLSSRLNDIPSSPLIPIDANHLLPSAPPSAPPASSDNTPSAPPLLQDDDENSAPSAPAFDIGEDDEEESREAESDLASSSQTRSNGNDGTSTHHVVGDLENGSQEVVVEHEEPEEEEEEHRDSQSTFSNAIPTRTGSGPGSTSLFLPRYEP